MPPRGNVNRVRQNVKTEEGPASLHEFLKGWAHSLPARSAVAATVEALAETSIDISNRVAQGALLGSLGRVVARGGEFDEQKEVDVLANDAIVAALRTAPVAAFASEELADPLVLDPAAPLIVAADPLDGSSNVEANVSFGMIFSIAFCNSSTPMLCAAEVTIG